MGIGEPFDNYQNLSISLKIFNEPYGIFLGARHITISTCGLIDKINQFSIDFPQINLSISLHSPIDKVRSEIMPINRKYNIQNLIDSLKQYIKKTRRRISFEYILLDDINDSDEDALLLAKLIKGMNCYVNLILYNIVSEHNYIRSKRVKQFNDILKQNKIVSTIRLERGSSISATCGKLRIQYEK
jgi:23S rRNA (adenine2503-C2)-methyltransferase